VRELRTHRVVLQILGPHHRHPCYPVENPVGKETQPDKKR
jgi:hypothetical protein